MVEVQFYLLIKIPDQNFWLCSSLLEFPVVEPGPFLAYFLIWDVVISNKVKRALQMKQLAPGDFWIRKEELSFMSNISSQITLHLIIIFGAKNLSGRLL